MANTPIKCFDFTALSSATLPTTFMSGILFGTFPIDLPAIAVDQDDYAPGGWYSRLVVRQALGASCALTGLVAVTGGVSVSFQLWVNTSATFSLTLKHEDLASTAANRFSLPGGVDFVIPPGGTVWLMYDANEARNKVAGGIPANVAQLDVAQTWTGAQTVAPSALTWAANIAVDATLSDTFTVTAGGATAQIDNPTGAVNGQTFVFRLLQNAGGQAFTFGTAYKWGLAGVPDFTTSGAGILDLVTGVSDGTNVYCSVARGFTP